jgi:HSP20 family protein
MNNMLMRRPFGLTTFDEIDGFFDDLFNSFRIDNTFVSLPSTDISYLDDGKTMRVDIEVPGYDRQDIQMSVDNNVLEIRGQKGQKEETKNKDRSYSVREISSSFARRIVLPDSADSEKIVAEMENGILTVTVPIEQPEIKRIEISSPKKIKN